MRDIRSVYGTWAALACGHPAAAAAGWEALAAGGGAADAAIAAAAVLTVVLPQACTLGGDAFILYHDAQAHQTVGLNASGRSPTNTDVSALLPELPSHGPLSCTTPGVVGGWQALHQRFGKLPWGRLLTRAIDTAQRGFPVSAGLAGAIAGYRSVLEQDPGASQLFLCGTPLTTGTILKQPALAVTLRAIAHDGASSFYRGRAASTISRYVQARGGWLHETDFATYQPEWTEPLRQRYRNLDVVVMPPNSYGLYMLLQLAALNECDFTGLSASAAERYAALIAAGQAAFASGSASVADPDKVGHNVPTALEPMGLAKLHEAFRNRVHCAPANLGGTAVVAVMDAQGNAAALVQSVFLGFGAGVLDPESGVLLNNRVLGFTTEPGHPNHVAAGQRPAHTLNPVMTFDNAGLRHVLLTPGGPGQTLTLTQVLQAMVDHNLPLNEAIALPRWSMNLIGTTVIEPELPSATIDALRHMNLPIQTASSGSPFFGSVECVARLPAGGLVAVADNRREAHVIAL